MHPSASFVLTVYCVYLEIEDLWKTRLQRRYINLYSPQMISPSSTFYFGFKVDIYTRTLCQVRFVVYR